MAYCNMCGAELQEGTRFCPVCGVGIPAAPAPGENMRSALPEGFATQHQRNRRKPVYKRWWFWVLILVVVSSIVGRPGLHRTPTERPGRDEPAVITTPDSVNPSTQDPGTTSEPEPTTPTVAENEIRPEVKEFLDSYEAFMDEYVAFMQKYSDADPSEMATMMADYFAMMSRYSEFAENIDAIDEEELTNAELAYYLEVTNRVNQKLLVVTGG